jgi:hypothetical protein
MVAMFEGRQPQAGVWKGFPKSNVKESRIPFLLIRRIGSQPSQSKGEREKQRRKERKEGKKERKVRRKKMDDDCSVNETVKVIDNNHRITSSRIFTTKNALGSDPMVATSCGDSTLRKGRSTVLERSYLVGGLIVWESGRIKISKTSSVSDLDDTVFTST